MFAVTVQMQHWVTVIVLLKLSPELCMPSCLPAMSLTNLCNFFERCVWCLSCFLFIFIAVTPGVVEAGKEQMTANLWQIENSTGGEAAGAAFALQSLSENSFIQFLKSCFFGISVWHEIRNGLAEGLESICGCHTSKASIEDPKWWGGVTIHDASMILPSYI